MNEEILSQIENLDYVKTEATLGDSLLSSPNKVNEENNDGSIDQSSDECDDLENESTIQTFIKKSGSPIEEGEIPDSEDSESESSVMPLFNERTEDPIVKQEPIISNVSPFYNQPNYSENIPYNNNNKFGERNSFYETKEMRRRHSPFDDRYSKNNNFNSNFKTNRYRNDTYNKERPPYSTEMKDNAGYSQNFYQKKHNKSEVANRYKERSYTPNDNVDTFKRDEFPQKRRAAKKEFTKFRDQSPYFKREIKKECFESYGNVFSPTKEKIYKDDRGYRRNDFGKDSYRPEVHDSPSTSRATLIRREIKQKFNRKMKADDYSPRLEPNRNYEKSYSPCEYSPKYQQAKAMESCDRYEKPTARQLSFSPNHDLMNSKDDDNDSDRERKKFKRTRKKGGHPLLSDFPIKQEPHTILDDTSKPDVEKPRRKRKKFDTPPNEKSNNNMIIVKNESDVSKEEKRKARALKRSSRWGDSQCMVSQHLRYEDAKVYSLQLELNEVTTNLAQKNYVKEYEAMRKLPDPDPIYGLDGKRLNTREQRARERLEERKKELMIQLHEIRPDLVQNVDKIMANRVYEKVFIPQEDYPDINFAGLIIGPRGMTQKELEKETDTKIILRGKGSVKVAKMAGTGQSLPGDDEPLHAYITSSKRENLANAAEKIRKIVKDAIDHPELENELRKNQMKQLAIINGTYRETEGLNKLKMREEINSIVTNTMICSLCGGTGHLPRDCKIGNMSLDPTNANFRDPEYKEFLTSIGKNIESTEVEVPAEKPSGVSNFIKNFVFKT